MRYAIWAAVSTQRQAAEDKVSLAEQERLCRERSAARGWQESAGPYVVPGESRTRHINLRDAEAAIPALRQMLDDAQRGLFDVLVLYDYTRLRELLDPVARALNAYGVQLYSLGQPVEPLEPGYDDPGDTASIIQTFSGLASRAEISALRRRFKLGMPKRVTVKGLHPLGRLPYGYRKAPGREYDPAAPAVPDPVTSLHVIQAKDLFLAGRSLTQIAATFKAQGVPSPWGRATWHTDSIRRILRNPYYAGIVTFGNYKRIRDPRTGQTRIDRRPDPRRLISAPGTHPPLWDQATHRRILSELARRGKASPGKRSARLSRLLRCPVCGSVLWVGYSSWEGHPAGDETRLYLCRQDRLHQVLKEREILPLFSRALADALKDIPPAQDRKEDPARAGSLSAALADLQSRRDRLTDAYAAGALPLPEYTRRAAAIDDQSRRIAGELSALEQSGQASADRQAAIRHAADMGALLGEYITHADAQEVNAILRNLLRSATINGKVVTFDWN